MKTKYHITEEEGRFYVQRRFFWTWWYVLRWYYDWGAGYHAPVEFESIDEARAFIAERTNPKRPIVHAP